MKNTLFTDYGTVKYNSFFDKSYIESNLNDYLDNLDIKIKDLESKTVLAYDKESKELYIYFRGEKSILKLTTDLKREFENNEDTKFNKKMRELLKISERKIKFFAIDKKGTFDSIEEADFYARYLEVLESEDELYDTLKIKLSGVREYIKNKAGVDSDIYKYHLRKEKEAEVKKIKKEKEFKIKMIEDDIYFINKKISDSEYTINKNISLIKKSEKCIFCDIVLGVLLVSICFMVNISSKIGALVTLFSILLNAAGLLFIILNIRDIFDYSKCIKSSKKSISDKTKRINELNEEKELIKTEIEELSESVSEKKEENNKTEVSENKEIEVNKNDNFYSKVDNYIKSLILLTEGLDESDKKEVRNEIKDIVTKYNNNNLELIKKNNEVFAYEESLILNINLFKSLRSVHSKIDDKIKIKKNIDEFENHISITEELLSNKGEVRVLEKH